MRRRFWLSRRSAESTGVGLVADVLSHLQQHLMGRDVYLSSRGYVSTDSHGWRRHVGFVGGVAAAEAGEHWVVEVETTEEYEVRQHEVVGGVTTGRQDLDAVEEIRRQLEVIATVAHAEITRGFNASMIHDQTAQAMGLRSSTTLQPGQIVYATSDGTVSATPSRHSPVVGTFLRMDGNNAVVALDGGGAVTMQVDSTATAQNVVAAVQASPAASMLQAAVDAGRSLYAGFRDALIRVGEAASAREDAYRQFTAISYTDRTEVAEVRSTSPMPVGYTVGSYTADIPITIHGDLDDLAAAMQRQSRELRAAARRRQDETTTQALTTTTQPCTYAVDAVEVSPDSTCAPWLSRLLPWLGSAVAADDAELRRLDDEVAATGQLVLVYVAERRALRVETRREWIAAGGGRMVWSTIRDRAAVLS